jgi:hypothetical protein
MIGADELSETLVDLFSRPKGGVVGLVEELLPICLEHDVEFEFQTDRSRVRPVGGNWEEFKNLVLPQSVFRAVIARVAALCGEQGHAVSPYGDEGELAIVGGSKPTLHVVFCNTPTVQRLSLRPLTVDAEAARRSENNGSP